MRPRDKGNGQADLPNTWTQENDQVRILTNDNHGNFFLEQTLNKDETPFKRDFVPEDKLPPSEPSPVVPTQTTHHTINPAITEKPRTWPSTLKKSTVSVVEKSRTGQLDIDDARTVESTTFSTSQVRVSASTTAAPRSLEQMLRMMEEKMRAESAASASRRKVAKGQKLLSTIREKVAAREQMDGEDMIVKNREESPKSVDLQPASSQQQVGSMEDEGLGQGAAALEGRKMARLRHRRRKLTQRAKALAKALGDITEEEPYVVFPMDDMNTKEKSVDEIFSGNPGLKRISAYDFEAAMFGTDQTTEVALPIAQLKLSIDDLASTMDKLSSTVHETTTKKDTESVDKISQLQEEIAKLTETLASLQIGPRLRLALPTTHTPRTIDLVTASSVGSPQTWGGLGLGEERSTTTERPWVRTTFQPRAPTLGPRAPTLRSRAPTIGPRAPTLAPLTLGVPSTTRRSFLNLIDSSLEMATEKHPTNRDDISTFFGSEEGPGDGPTVVQGPAFEPPPGGVLGLFEKMRKIHSAGTRQSVEVVEPPSQEQQQERFQQMQELLRRRQMDRVRAEEEDLREQQRRKLEMFNLLVEQEDQEVLEVQETRRLQELETRRQNALKDNMAAVKKEMLQEQRQHQQGEAPGVAVASITIENVDNSRDYEVTDNGIVRLRKPGDAGPEYEYEYYEADNLDDIQFPVGGTKQFYQEQPAGRAEDPLNGLSNKELLMNLLQASNNFQNREFLDRLRTIVSGVEEEAQEEGQGSVALLGQPGAQGWAPSSLHTNAPSSLHTKAPRLNNNANLLPIWPANNLFGTEPAGTAQESDFRPLRSPVRFPNRRMDVGTGEVSIVTGEERRRATGLSSFGLEPVTRAASSLHGRSRISSVLDSTSDQEFLVSTSMAMQSGRKALPPPAAGRGSVTVFDREPGGAQPGRAYSGYPSGTYRYTSGSSGYSSGSRHGSGTATPVQGAEVYRQGGGVPVQEQSAAAGGNYILPTYSSHQYGVLDRQQGEIYSDIRVEAGKKNLLTLPTDPNKMYIKAAAARPEAEVILYPAGQLLSSLQPAGGPDPMLMAGTDEVLLAQDTYSLSPGMAELLDRDTELFDPGAGGGEPAPSGLLETILRSAKDDLKFGSQVINFLQANGR